MGYVREYVNRCRRTHCVYSIRFPTVKTESSEKVFIWNILFYLPNIFPFFYIKWANTYRKIQQKKKCAVHSVQQQRAEYERNDDRTHSRMDVWQ